MKKIVLGCAAVLLSLGLLAGCNNEENDKAVSITVDSVATVVVGESLELPYTVEPEKADVVAESSNESVLEAVAQDGILYLEGIAEGSASVTLMGTYKKYTDAFASVSVTVTTKATEDTGPGEEEPDDTGGTTGPGEQVITLSGVPETLDVALDGEATITPVATPEGAVIEYAIDDDTIVSLTNTAEEEGEYEFTVTPLEVGTTNIVFTASLEAEGYDAVTATTAVTVHEEGWTEPEPEPDPEPDPETGTASNITLILNLYDQNDNEYVLPEWLDLYMYGSWMDDTNLSTESNAVKLTYHGDNDTYYGNYYSLTIEGEIAFDTYEYHLFVVYNDGMNKDVISWSNDVYTGWFDINYAGDGYDYRLTWTVTDDLETEYPDPNAVGTVEQQTNHKINFYFVSDSNHTTFYEIPSYADGYLCGYFDGSNWTGYTIGGSTKLAANGNSGEDGYSVTLDAVKTGSITVNIYFEFNSSAQNHTPLTDGSDGSWDADRSVFGSSNGQITIDNTEGATYSDVYIECDPSTLISDEANFCDLIVRVINSGSSGKTLYISGINGWTAHTMTAVTGQDYQYEYEDASVDKGSSLEFGIYNDSSWGDSLLFATVVSGSYWNSGNNICFDGNHTNYDTTIITLTADCSVMGTSTTHASITNVTITH